MAGSMGLTEAQEKEFSTLFHKDEEKLTEIQKKKLLTLSEKKTSFELPQGAKTYCDAWIKEQIYGRRKTFSSKFTHKGNVVEDNSLDFIAEQLDYGMLFKNEDDLEDEFKTGHTDTIVEDLIIDAKNSWDCFTFPLLADELPEKAYEYQGISYMSLTGLRRYKVVYVLSDTPMYLIEREAFYYCKENGYDGLDPDVLGEFVAKMTYPDIEDKFKIKVFNVEYDQKVVDEIHGRVIACRKYIEEKTKDLWNEVIF